MTAPRQQRKIRLAFGLLAALTCALTCATAAPAAAPEPLVVNPNTGLALSGFDPVAYFTDGKPQFGRPELEFRNNGAVWRFRNEGDRAAFADHPEVYMPRFGGYDPVAEVVFGDLAIDGFFLEYDSPRAGSFKPLRFMPKDKAVVLGLISTKTAELEKSDELKKRIEEASAYVDIERLGLSPQCGF